MRSLARFEGRLNAIEPRPDVVRWPRVRLRRVLTHEIAHPAVFLLHGPAGRACGPQWRSLMDIAGVGTSPRVLAPSRPSATAPAGIVAAPAGQGGPGGSRRYGHRGSGCQMIRIARQPVPDSPCGDCGNAGLQGRLIITALGKAR